MARQKRGKVERVARIICRSIGRDPDHLEPGNAYTVDAILTNGDPAHLYWRQFADTARNIIRALKKD